MTSYGYQLTKVAKRQLPVITLEQAKQQCEIDSDITAHDALLREMIEEATDFIEQRLHSTLLRTGYVLRLDDWPCVQPGVIGLPMGPVIAVQEVRYLDSNGDAQVQPAEDYRLIHEPTAGWLSPVYSKWWPTARAGAAGIEIAYEAGYEGEGSPEDASGVPSSIKRAAKYLVAHWFENREAILAGTSSKEIELGFDSALQPYRNYFP